MVKYIICLTLSVVLLCGCNQEMKDVTGRDFVKILKARKSGQSIVFRNGTDGYYYLELYQLPPTQSIFKKIGTIRTTKANLSIDELTFVEKNAKEDSWVKPLK